MDLPDALLDQLDDYMNGRVKEEDEDEACDSQLTEYDDDHWPAEPSPKRQRCTSPPRHFTKSGEFWESVEKEVRYYMNDEWFSTADFNDLSEDWERNVSTVERAVKSIALGSMEFKIGICRDPKWRWFVCNGGKYSKQFTKMTIVYVAKSSKPKHSESTGNMEIAQISKFKNESYPHCLNEAPGGEMPSDGSPHFCYVVSN